MLRRNAFMHGFFFDGCLVKWMLQQAKRAKKQSKHNDMRWRVFAKIFSITFFGSILVSESERERTVKEIKMQEEKEEKC